MFADTEGVVETLRGSHLDYEAQIRQLRNSLEDCESM